MKFKALFKICLFYKKLWIASKMLTKGRILFWTTDFFKPNNNLKLCQCLPCLFIVTKHMQFKLFLSGWCFPDFIMLTEISLNEKYLLQAAKFGRILSSKFCLRTDRSYKITQWSGTRSSYQLLISKPKLISNIFFLYIHRVLHRHSYLKHSYKLRCACIIKHSLKF